MNSTSSSPIARGTHFGTPRQSLRIGPFIVCETRFAPSLETPVHSHEGCAFSLTLSGGYTQRFHGYDIVYEAGAAVFRPARVRHSDVISVRGAHCFIVEPHGAWLASNGLHEELLERGSAIQHPRVSWLLEYARREWRAGDESTQLVLEGVMLAVAAEFTRARRTVPSRKDRFPSWLRRTRDTLQDERQWGLTVAALAADAGVHPVHLARSFKAYFGVSIGEYVRMQRIAAACTALLSPERTINDIALSLGFCSQSHFGRVFRAHVGATPRHWRRQQLGMPELPA